MNQPNRLAVGGRIDRSKPLRFVFDGRAYEGFAGDTLASALLANGVDIIGRSFKYRRPRGIVGAGPEEPNAIVQIGNGAKTVPNVRATQAELYGGLEARSVSGWPGPGFDLGSVAGWFGALMPPGFYYKTFMSPARLWPAYESVLRKVAGLGRSPVETDPDRYDKLHHHCELLVVGAGPAGLEAARDAARSGIRVIIVDEQSEPGGCYLSSTETTDGSEADAWVTGIVAELEEMDNVLLLTRTTAFGLYDHNLVGAVERRTDHLANPDPRLSRQRLHIIRSRDIVLATGEIERPLVFANNDRPGVMLASAVSAYVNRYGVAPGQDLVVVTNNDRGYRCALDWAATGRNVIAVVDTRPAVSGDLPDKARSLGIRVLDGHGVVDVKGRRRVKAAIVAPIGEEGSRTTGAAFSLDCDLLAMSGGASPVVHLSSHTGRRPVWSDDAIGFLPADPPGNLRYVGACGGDCGDASQSAQALFRIPHARPAYKAPKQFVDFQLDVTAQAIELAAAEGYESIEHVKRYTALGFGTDQGKLGNVNGMAVLAGTTGNTLAETGTTVFRPPYTPQTFGALAGRAAGELFDPIRYTAIHRWHEEYGAVWEDVGQWKRPRYYPLGEESMADAVNRECLAVRTDVGMLDASTLGKIDIQGPDAAEFLNRIYTNAWLKLEPGRCRYGVMLNEDGMIFDDGVTACIEPNRYLMHTTTGNAAAVLAWLEFWHQTEWPELQVYFTSVTDHWATVTVSGPKARRVLEKVCTDVMLDAESFRFMDWKEALVAGVPARIFRISFTGELSFEINVQANFGRYTWEQVYDAGREFGITPYGTETMHVLRAEKGFIIIGQDTDGSVTPIDAGMQWAVNRKKNFSFVGERSLDRSDCVRAGRKELIGLRPVVPDRVLPEGAQIVADRVHGSPADMHGHVTSSYFSAFLGHSFALAMLRDGRSRIGERVYCPLAGGEVLAAEVVSPVFYDPEGKQQHVE